MLTVHGKKVGKKELKNIMKWVCTNIPDASEFNILSKVLWDSVRVKLYDLTTKKNSAAPQMLPTFQAILETLKAEEKCCGPNSNTTFHMGQSLILITLEVGQGKDPMLCG